MNVLSLFDGMSCGRIALERAGVAVTNYYASEVDKYAIKVAQANYPDTVQLGDITNVKASQLPRIDLIIGGSPCQGFSFAGKQGGLDDPRSALFYEYVRLLSEVQQYNLNVKFLLENVRMKKDSLNLITLVMGVEPEFINSALVSAQNRQRYYWTNIPGVCQPEDRGIVLADILETGVADRDKSFCIDANYWKGGNLKSYFEKHRRQLVFEARNGKKVEINDYDINRPKTVYETRTELGKKLRREHFKLTGNDSSKRGPEHKKYVVQKHEKSNCLVTVDSELNMVIDKEFYYRKLTPIECERLQTVPDNYTNHVSNTQRYKMLGNGWTVDVVAHIFKGLNQ